MKIYIDGKFYAREEATVSVFDHGLLYGDGIFEGIRFYNGRVFRLDEHVRRLYDSAKAIALTIPMTQEEMARAVVETIKTNEISDGYVRLVVTRGVGDLGLNPLNCPKPGIIIIASKITLYPAEMYEKGLAMATCSTRRVSHGAFSPMVKSLNYLNNVLAKLEALQAKAGEGLMLNEAGYVAECTGDNVFIVKRGELLTPPISAGALAGVTRETVIELARELGISVREPELTRYDIYTADECFLTGTAAEIIPAVTLDGRPIGDGKPGAVTGKLRAAFSKLIASSGTPIE